MDDFDGNEYGIRYIYDTVQHQSVVPIDLLFTGLSSPKSVQRIRGNLALPSTRQQNHTIQSISHEVDRIKERFPNRGADSIRKALQLESGIRVPRYDPLLL